MKGLVWTDLSRDEVEQLLAALLMEMYPGAYRMEGAGGDDGIDVGRPDGHGGLIITQIKSFARPLQPKQKPQVTNSAIEAAKHHPVRWELLLPLDHSPKAKKWFEDVVAPATGCEAVWLGKSWIELHLAGRPHLLRLVRSVREQTLETIAQYGAEQAALAGGAPDLLKRSRRLQQLGDTLDPYYRFRTTSDADFQQIDIIARSSEAARHSPIKGSFGFEVPDDTPEAQAFQENLEDFLAYGGEIEIPSNYISNFRVDLPAGLGVDWAKDDPQSPLGVPTLKLGPDAESAAWHESGRLTVKGPTGQVLSTARLNWAGRSSGEVGGTLNASDPTGCLNLTVRFNKQTGECTLTFNLRVPEGCTPDEPLELLKTLKLMKSPNRIRFHIGTHELLTVVGDPDYPGIEPLEDLLLALQRIASVAGPFTLPAEFGPQALTDIYWADQLLQGARIPVPVTEFTASLTVMDVDEFKAQEIDEPRWLGLGSEFIVHLPNGPVSIGQCIMFFQALPSDPAMLKRMKRTVKVGDSLRLVLKIVEGSAHLALGGPPTSDAGPAAA